MSTCWICKTGNSRGSAPKAGRGLFLTAAALTAFATAQNAPLPETELVDPVRLHREVDNTLRFEQAGAGFVVAGETDESSRYQLGSERIELAPDTVALQMRLKGTILHGVLYLGVVGQDGRFLDPLGSYSEGPLPDPGPLVLTGHNRSVRVVLGNIGPTRSRWRIESLVVVQLNFHPQPDFEFRAAYLGGLPPTLNKPVANSIKLVRTPHGIALAGQTDATQRYQLASRRLHVEEGTSLIRLSVRGRVLRGRIYFGLLNAKGRFLGGAHFADAGPIINSEILANPGDTPAVTLVVGNGMEEPSELAISALSLEMLDSRERSGAIRRYADAQGFKGSVWAWAWRVLFGR